MPVIEMGSFIENARDDFRVLLEDGQNELTRFLKECLDKCSGALEEDVLRENLVEVYTEYLNDAFNYATML